METRPGNSSSGHSRDKDICWFRGRVVPVIFSLDRSLDGMGSRWDLERLAIDRLLSTVIAPCALFFEELRSSTINLHGSDRSGSLE